MKRTTIVSSLAFLIIASIAKAPHIPQHHLSQHESIVSPSGSFLP